MKRRLAAAIEKQFGDRSRRPVQRVLRWVIERAGINWDTFYRKLNGHRRIQAADVELFARALGLRSAWLGSGEKPVLDGRPLDPLVVTFGLGAGIVGKRLKRPRGRPPKPRSRPPSFRLGLRIAGERAAARPDLEDLGEQDILERLKTEPEIGTLAGGELHSPRLQLAAELLVHELERAKPRRRVVELLLRVVDFLEEGAKARNPHYYRPLRNGLRAQLEFLGMWGTPPPSGQPAGPH